MKHANKPLTARLRRLPLRFRLFFLVFAICLISVSALAVMMINVYQRDMVRSAGEQTLAALRQTAQHIDQKIATINDALDQVALDSGLTAFFIERQAGGKELEARDIYLFSEAIRKTISRYLRQEDIDTFLLYTDSLIVGSLLSFNSPWISTESFRASDVYGAAVAANYRTVWLPAYDLWDAFDLAPAPKTIDREQYRTVFSAVRQMNFMSVENTTLRMLPAEAQRPVLLVNLPAAALGKWIGSDVGYDRLRYRLWSADHACFFDSAPSGSPDPGFFALVQAGETVFGEAFDRRMAHIASIPSSRWYITCDVPLADVVGVATRDALGLLWLWAVLLLVVAGVWAYLVARGVTRPIAAMTGAVQAVAQGDFSARIQEPSEYEFWTLTAAFNRMGGEIQRLIRENYEIKLKETQSQLMALNLQLNPHFLRNTLSVMNLIALENAQNELSGMINALSMMLQYTLRRTEGLVSLAGELAWLKNYLTIMEVRFEGMFVVEYSVESEALRLAVPKLILQPIVENCFAHGEIGARPGGCILLSANTRAHALWLAVEDNGRGMDTERVMEEMRRPALNGRIGLSNAYQRLKLLYGEEADIRLETLSPSGSRVTLVLPASVAERPIDLSN